jgi:hypothetical protein
MNDFSRSGVNRRRAIILSVVVALLIVGFLMYKGVDKVVNNEIDQSVIVTGSFSCLPSKNANDPERGCVLGVKSRDGVYYALDISRIQDANTDLKADDTIAVTGFLRPESEIKGSDWESYDIKSIIQVNTLLRTK